LLTRWLVFWPVSGHGIPSKETGSQWLRGKFADSLRCEGDGGKVLAFTGSFLSKKAGALGCKRPEGAPRRWKKRFGNGAV